jgi:hypothetical protein
LQLVAIHNFHQSLYSILLVIGLNGLVLVTLGLVYLLRINNSEGNLNMANIKR